MYIQGSGSERYFTTSLVPYGNQSFWILGEVQLQSQKYSCAFESPYVHLHVVVTGKQPLQPVGLTTNDTGDVISAANSDQPMTTCSCLASSCRVDCYQFLKTKKQIRWLSKPMVFTGNMPIINQKGQLVSFTQVQEAYGNVTFVKWKHQPMQPQLNNFETNIKLALASINVYVALVVTVL